MGFVEEQGEKEKERKKKKLMLKFFFVFLDRLYCEDCYGKYLAPDCEKCRKKILGVSFWGV